MDRDFEETVVVSAKELDEATIIVPEENLEEGTVLVSRTKNLVEEATVVTSHGSVDEATVTGDQTAGRTHTDSGFVEAPTPTFTETTNSAVEVTEEAAPVRQVAEAYDAPSSTERAPQVHTPANPLKMPEIQPEPIKKSEPDFIDDRAKLFEKNLNRTKRNSLVVVVAVVIGAVLVGVVGALIWVKFR